MAEAAPAAHVADTLPALFMGVAWDTLLEGNVRTLIERESLVPFLQRQRWFGGKARALRSARFVDWGVLRRGLQPVFITIVQADYQDGGREQYSVPLALVDGPAADAVLTSMPHAALARVSGARKGLIVDGAADDHALRVLLDMFDTQETGLYETRGLQDQADAAFLATRGDGPLAPRRLGAEQSNTSLAFGDRLVAKDLPPRRAGPNPDVEIGEFLTTRTNYARVPRIGAFLEYEPAGLPPFTHLAEVNELVKNQADGWNHALAELSRYYDEVHRRPEPVAGLDPRRARWI